MKANEAKLATILSTEEAAQVFRTAAHAEAPKVGRKMQFFTPTPDDSPFAEFEEQPTFAVGALIPKLGLGRRYKGVLKGALFHDLDMALVGPKAAMHMYVYEQQVNRHIELYSPYESLGGAESRRLLERFVQAFVAADSSAQMLR